MYVDLSNKRFALADEGGEPNAQRLHMARLKRIADSSGTRVRVAHASQTIETSRFAILAIMANPSNMSHVPPADDRKNFVLMTQSVFSTFTQHASEVDEANFVFQADTGFKSDASIDLNRIHMLALLAEYYDRDFDIMVKIPTSIVETTRTWDRGVASNTDHMPAAIEHVQLDVFNFKTENEMIDHLVTRVQSMLVRNTGCRVFITVCTAVEQIGIRNFNFKLQFPSHRKLWSA